jgi:hypothetical protein
MAGVFEQLPQFGLDRGDLGLEPVAVLMLVLVGAPGGAHLAGEREAVFAEGLLLAQTVGVAAEVALQSGLRNTTRRWPATGCSVIGLGAECIAMKRGWA